MMLFTVYVSSVLELNYHSEKNQNAWNFVNASECFDGRTQI